MNSALRHLALRHWSRPAAVAWTVMLAILASTQAIASVETLLRPADVRSVVVSPDGGHLAMVRSDSEKEPW